MSIKVECEWDISSITVELDKKKVIPVGQDNYQFMMSLDQAKLLMLRLNSAIAQYEELDRACEEHDKGEE